MWSSGNQERNQDDGLWGLEGMQFQFGRNGARNKRELEFNREKDHEKLPLFRFSCLETATAYFSEANKLGEGGYGPVYKVTVYSLWKIMLHGDACCSNAFNSMCVFQGQLVEGLEEFQNEVTLISKLQHRNLVRLLGCCIQREEYILVYEYMANKSLDSFIFGL